MTAGLELRQLACVRGGRRLFSGLDAQVQAGQLLRVLGANGAGKTSLLRMVCGLASPARGEVLWQGRRVGELREDFNRQLVHIGHAAALKDDLTPVENLLAACRLGGVAPTERAAAAALAQAGLRGRERVPSRHLSQGQRRRVALARLVLAEGSWLWVLDEPFNALDTAATEWLSGLVTGQLLCGGVVVLTSHQAVPLPPSVQQVELAL
jgi:heme exporter protein A